jgi:hypothetical protein
MTSGELTLRTQPSHRPQHIMTSPTLHNMQKPQLVDQFLPTHSGRGSMQASHGRHDFALRLR